jgi:hypothetical protein
MDPSVLGELRSVSSGLNIATLPLGYKSWASNQLLGLIIAFKLFDKQERPEKRTAEY